MSECTYKAEEYGLYSEGCGRLGLIYFFALSAGVVGEAEWFMATLPLFVGSSQNVFLAKVQTIPIVLLT